MKKSPSGAPGSGIKSTLSSWITIERDRDGPPSKTIPLESIPVIGVRTQPVLGISLHYGTSDIPNVLSHQMRAAAAAGRNLYEVRVVVDITAKRLLPSLDESVLQADRERPVDERASQIIQLSRTKEGADDYLRALIEAELSLLNDAEILKWRLSKVVARYPHVLDALAAHPELRHVIMFIWESDVPGPGPDEGGEGVIKNTRIATLYRRDRVLEITTLNSDYVTAELPDFGVDFSAAEPAAFAVGPKLG